ncbi:MAG: alpha/beta hydrolase [Mycobacterium sp.]
MRPTPGVRRRVNRNTAAAAAVVVLAGCGSTVAGRPAGLSGAPEPAVTAVNWGPCDSAGGNGDPPGGAQCGELPVPVDYSDPGKDVATLALIRLPATGDKIGSLVVNPGGPGDSGVEAAISLVDDLPKEVRERFDLVGFDPRGVGSSAPALWCNSDADNDALRADPQVDYSPAGVAHIEATEKQYVQRCLDKMGKPFLANVGTANVARDLDRLREALGDAKLTYLGYSYGTLIGSAYAEAYPDKVRAMILDGAVDPNTDPIQSNIDQSAAFQKAFDDYASDCAKDSDCPLGTDPTKVVAAYHDLVNPLVNEPARTDDPRGLGYSDAITATDEAMYSPERWSDLTKGLRELSGGRGDTLLALADDYWERDQNGHYSNSNDALTAIICVDQPQITDRARAVEEDRRLREVAPYSSYGTFTGNAPLDTCAFWPVPPTSGPHQISAPGLPPVLVVSTTDDPATPYQAGVDLAGQLGGALLTYRGTQHTVVFEGEECVDGYATRYLVDLTLPPKGATC